MSRFAVIARQFILGSITNLDEYAGTVVASRDGFYFLFSESQFGQSFESFRLKIGGKPVIVKKSNSYENDSVARGDIGDLPKEITSDATWPPMNGLSKVWFVPRAVIDNVQVSILYGVKIVAGDFKVNCGVGLFSHGKVRKTLCELDWLE